MRIYWLPATISAISNSVPLLLEATESKFRHLHSKFPSASTTIRYIHAKVMIYSAAKSLDIIHADELVSSLIKL